MILFDGASFVGAKQIVNTRSGVLFRSHFTLQILVVALPVDHSLVDKRLLLLVAQIAPRLSEKNHDLVGFDAGIGFQNLATFRLAKKEVSANVSLRSLDDFSLLQAQHQSHAFLSLAAVPFFDQVHVAKQKVVRHELIDSIKDG